MRTHRLLSATLLAAAVALGAGPVSASHQEATLGSAGELYVLRTGTYGQLFPTGTEVDKENPVLAVDILRPGAAADRRLIAGTKDKDVEGTPAAVFEDDSSTLFVIWESRINSIHSIFRLASFDGSHWSEPIDITGNPFSVKTPPQIAVTRDSHREKESDGSSSTHHRTILHISWAEENGAGLYDAFYTPIILDEGSYLGWNPVYRLDSFDTSATSVAVAASAAPPELVRAPTLQPGQDGRTIVAAFASSVSGQMSSVEIDVLPSQLQRLAEKARGYIIDLGVRRKVTDLAVLSTRTRAYILENGDDYQPEVARSIADQVAAYVLSNGGHGGTPGPGGIQNIAVGARGYIIDLGAKFSGRGLKSSPTSSTADEAAPLNLEIATTPTGGGSSDPAAHIFQVRSASGRQAPAIGEGSVRVFASETGDEILVSWAGSDRVTYRISQGDGWSDPREIRTSESLDLNGVYDILAQRVRRR